MRDDLSKDHWHPSGRTPVYDEDMNLAGYTQFRISCRSVLLTKAEPADERRASIEAMRMLFHPENGAPYWIYWVSNGEPTQLPGFFALN